MACNKRNSITILSLATSPNGTARNGTTTAIDLAHPGMMVAECYSEITTSSVLATFTLQVSADNGTTWYDIETLTTAAGTGSPVLTYKSKCFDRSYHAYRLCRVKAVLSGAATAAADKTQVVLRMVQPGGVGDF